MTNRSTTTERLTPRFGIVGAVFLHACAIAAMIFGVAHKLDIVDQSPPIIPIDLVTVADTTNIAPEVKAEPMPTPPLPNMVEPVAPPMPQPPQLEVAPNSKPVPQKVPPKKNAAQAFNDMLASLNVPNAKVGSRNIQRVGAGTGMTADLRAILQSEIERCWSPPVGAPHVEDLIVTFQISLNPDGTVSEEPQLAANSGLSRR